jgi:ACS family sodium-dependent inorganic phosphate cotransporter-like MFS transporter 5
MLAYWVPQQERGTALALIQVGGNLGAVLTMPLSAYLVQNGFAGGWPSVFYVLGSFGCLCFIPWMYEIYNSPAEHPRIRGKELIYIQANVSVSSSSSKKKKKVWVPWRSICTSAQVWVVVITKFCSSWGNLFLMSKLPTYLESILHLSMSNVLKICKSNKLELTIC